MKLKPEELFENGYILLDRMDHLELIPFVKKYLNKGTWFSIIYYLSIVVSFFVLLFYCIQLFHSGEYSIIRIIRQISFGVLIFFTLIPIHEVIHALTYKLMGAEKTSFDVNLKKFYFLAIADKFVANSREFRIVALSPFLGISLMLLIAAFLAGELGRVTILTMLVLHSMACSGDFALLSYFEVNKEKEVVTYDDRENKVSFFYGKEKQKEILH